MNFDRIYSLIMEQSANKPIPKDVIDAVQRGKSQKILSYDDYLRNLYGDNYSNTVQAVKDLRDKDNRPDILKWTADPKYSDSDTTIEPMSPSEERSGYHATGEKSGKIEYSTKPWRGLSSKDPDTIAKTIAHELGHTAQNYSNWGYNRQNADTIPHAARPVEFDRYLAELLHVAIQLGWEHPANTSNPSKYTKALINSIINTRWQDLPDDQKAKIKPDAYYELQIKLNDLLKHRKWEDIEYMLPRTYGKVEGQSSKEIA